MLEMEKKPQEGKVVRRLITENYVKYTDAERLIPILKRMGCPHYISNGYVRQYLEVPGKEPEEVRTEQQYRSFFEFTSPVASKRLTKEQFFWVLVDHKFIENPHNNEILDEIIKNNYIISEEIQNRINELKEQLNG